MSQMPTTTITSAASLRVFALVAGVTGHRVEELDREMYLECDLGMDSIKMVELMNALLGILSDEERTALGGRLSPDSLMQAQTLGELIDLLAEGETHAAAPDAGAEAAVLEAAHSEAEAETSVELPIAWAQYPFLVAHWAVSPCSLCSRLRLRGAFDPHRARLAWQGLLDRHPLLRGRFVIPAGAASFKDYRLEAAARVEAPELALTDLSQLDAAAREAALADETHRNVNREWDLTQWPLHRFYAFRLEDDLFELVLTVHHLCSDGLSMQQLLREFLGLYANAETLAPITPEQYRATVEAMNVWHNPEQGQALESSLRAQGKDRFQWLPQGRASGAARSRTRCFGFSLDADTTARLLSGTAAWRLSMNTLLVGAYLRALNRLSAGAGGSAGAVVLNIPTGGRDYPGVDASQLVGCFAQNLALTFAAPGAAEDWGVLLARVDETLRQAIGAGHDHAQIRQAALTARDRLRLADGRLTEPLAGVVRSGVKSNLYLPYIGQVRLEPRYGELEVLDYHAATATNPNTVDLLAEVVHGRLTFTANYDSQSFSEALIQRLAEVLTSQLRDLAKARDAATVPARKQRPMASAKPATLAQLRELAGAVLGRAAGTDDLDRDLEADLGLDSLERVRIVTRLQGARGRIDHQALLACRTLAEMAGVLDGVDAAPAATSEPVTVSVPAGPAGAKQAAIPYLAIVEQCRRTPGATAVAWEYGAMSYAELARRSNRLAHYLRARGVKAGDRVGVMLRRGPELMVAVLGILKAGAAYLPLDPDYPASRLSYMLRHAKADLLVSEATLDGTLTAVLNDPLPLSSVLLVDVEQAGADLGGVRLVGSAVLADCAETDPPCEHSPDDLMVVLYTSGSTGTPKGVALGHRGYANRLRWHQDLYQLQPGERVAQKTSVCFDISVWELLWPLMHGATVCPVQSEVVRNPWRLAEWMAHARINVMHFVPSLFGEFLAALEEDRPFPDLRWLVFSGEALPVPLVQRWMDRFGNRVGLANLYGPTEASIDVTAHIVRHRPADGTPRIPIGRAMNNVHLLVLDEHMRKLPPGEVGELWIGGVQLAKGYLDDPQRTCEAFVANSFFTVPGTHLYRTGDLVVQLPGGELDYRGRKDSQVKIRGFRVELGEVEAALNALPGVREAAVRVVEGEDGQKRIHAWLAGTSRDHRALRTELAPRLPDYMMPHASRWLDSLPKNSNGKLDRKALPAMDSCAPGAQIESDSDPATLPLGPAQNWLLTYFPAPYRWAGFTRFAYRQPLDLELLNRALAVLAGRHPILNAEFCRDGRGWVQRVQPTGDRPSADAPPVDFYDGSHMSSEQREAEVRVLLESAAGELTLESRPLWRVLVVKCAEDRYDISLAGHHMISDLLSNGILFRELWRIYGDLLLDHEPRLGAVVTYGDYLERLQALGPQRVHYREFWKRHLQGGCFQVPVDHRLGDNVVESAASEVFSLGREEVEALHRARRHYGVSLYHLLLASLYRALGEWTGSSRVVLSHRSHGRDLGSATVPDKAIRDGQETDTKAFFASVGNFAVNFPVAVNLASNASWAELLRTIQDELASLPLNGVSYDLVGAELPEELYPDHKLTPVRANFLGERSLPVSELFEFDAADWDRRYSPPGQPRISLLEVFLSQNSGSLKVELEYSRNFHSAETIRGLCQRYRELLAELSASLPRQPAPRSLRAVHGSGAGVASGQPVTALSPRAPGSEPEAVPPGHSRPLAGKVAIVTGASRGIGRAVALKLAAQGARLALVARHREDLEQTLLDVRRCQVQALAVAADVADLAQVQAMVAQVVETLGGVDILVNNAGVTGLAALADSDPGHWRRIMDVNLFGTYHCCQAVLPQLLRRGGGKIVNMGSDSSVIGYPLFGAYAASKHAVLGLTKSLAEEVKGHNVQVNAVCPAFVDTTMTPEAFRKSAIPTEQVAEVVAFLASPAADGITGEPIRVFGRQDMYWYGSGKMALVQAVAN